MPSYIQNLRSKIGTQHIFYPGARLIIENEKGEILLIRRSDNGRWGLVAGGLETNEDLTQCIIREAKEETGLEIINPRPIGLSSRPEIETVTYSNGDVTQYCTLVFHCTRWKGTLSKSTPEATEIRFFTKENLPELSPNEAPAISWLERFRKSGKFIVE